MVTGVARLLGVVLMLLGLVGAAPMVIGLVSPRLRDLYATQHEEDPVALRAKLSAGLCLMLFVAWVGLWMLARA